MVGLFLFLFAAALSSFAAPDGAKHEVDTNAVYMAEAPSWVSRVRVDKLVDHIQMILEWDIRKIKVYWYSDEGAFERMHGLGPSMMAISRKTDDTVHLGPRINDANFDQIFSHELVHIIAHQKYKAAIPAWLEEGLANYLSKSAKVDYKLLSSRPAPSDVRAFTHPTKGSPDDIHYHYMVSQALTEMIASKCDLSQLLQLSVGKSVDKYLDTYCEIKDLNQSFAKWIKSHG